MLLLAFCQAEPAGSAPMSVVKVSSAFAQ